MNQVSIKDFSSWESGMGIQVTPSTASTIYRAAIRSVLAAKEDYAFQGVDTQCHLKADSQIIKSVGRCPNSGICMDSIGASVNWK